MFYVGVDLHKEQSWFFVMDQEGKKISSKSIANCNDKLNNYFKTIPKPFELAVESTYNWYFLVDMAEQYANEVFLANSYELKAFAKRHKKTDKIDARLIGDILRKGYLPTVTIPDKYIRTIKEALSFRLNIVKDRSRNIFRLKSLLDKLGGKCTGRITSYKRLDQLRSADYPNEYKHIILGYIDRIYFLNQKLSESDQHIRNCFGKDPDVNNLRTIPGIDYFSAALIKSEIIDINRFKSFNRLCAYAGLAPRVHQSANKLIHGSLNVNRRKKLQWILIEIVYSYIQSLPDKTKKYEVIKKRRGSNVAKVSLARDMLKIIYHILKDKREFSFIY
ncbi:MAG: IS110 family transposase [PVC group bacterium]|nr:IS110 family transposase [PVC group bacterium]